MSNLWASLRRMYFVFVKSWWQILQDWLVLCLTLVFAPLFIVLYYLITAGGSTSYGVAVVNLDLGAAGVNGQHIELGSQAVQAIGTVQYENEQPILRLLQADSLEDAEQMMRDRAGAVFLVIPEGFTQAVLRLQAGDEPQPLSIIFGGDLTNPYYSVASILAISALEEYIQQVTAQTPLLAYQERALGASAARTEFEIYVPGILVFAIIMLVFLAAMTIAREVEAGTLRRLQLTPLTALEYLGGVAAALTLVGLISEFLSFGAAIACGFRSEGPLLVAVLVGALTSLAVIGTGLMVAALSRNVSQAFVIANFPLGLFMFFSGTVYPLPKVALFTVGHQVISLYDILPPTHAVAALNKVFVMGAGIREVGYEIGALIFLSLLYFFAGAWLFQRMKGR